MLKVIVKAIIVRRQRGNKKGDIAIHKMFNSVKFIERLSGREMKVGPCPAS